MAVEVLLHGHDHAHDPGELVAARVLLQLLPPLLHRLRRWAEAVAVAAQRLGLVLGQVCVHDHERVHAREQERGHVHVHGLAGLAELALPRQPQSVPTDVRTS